MALAGKQMRVLAHSQKAARTARLAPRSISRPANRRTVAPKAFFNFFGSDAPKSSARAAELVEEVLTVCTNPRAPKDDLDELVGELQGLGVKNPVKNNLHYGQYELVYSSKPSIFGTPGSAVQTIDKPDLIETVVVTKSFFSDGYVKQSGTFKAVSGDTFVYTLRRTESKSGFGGPKVQEIEEEGQVQVLYLDDGVRIVSVSAGDDDEGALVVFRRVVEEEEEEDAAENEDDEEDSKPAGLFGSFGRSAPSLATQAERQVKQELTQGRSAPPGRAPAARVVPAAPAPAKVDPRVTKQKAEQEKGKAGAERQAALKKAEQEKQAAKLRAEQERKRLEEEKEAEKKRMVAVREQLAELADELKEAQAETREVANTLRGIERENGATLKQVAVARSKIDGAIAETAEVEEEFAELLEKIKKDEAELKVAQEEVKAAQAKLRSLFVTK